MVSITPFYGNEIAFQQAVLRVLSVIPLLLFMSFSASAEKCGPYHLPNSKAIPEIVQQSSRSVFEMRTLSGGPDDFVTSPFDLEKELLATDGVESFFTWPIRTCIELKSLKCLRSFKLELGSIFLYEDNNTLVTSLHSVSDYLLAKLKQMGKVNSPLNEQIEVIKTIKIPAFVAEGGQQQRDWNLEVSLVDYVQVKEIFINKPLAEYQKVFESEESDWNSRLSYNVHDIVILKTSEPIEGTPLQPSPLMWGQIQSTYAVGFPEPPETTSLSNDNCETYHSNGYSKYISTGGRITGGNAFVDEVLDPVSPLMLPLLGTAHEGFSGGPILDPQGRVLGVTTYSFGGTVFLGVPIP